MHVEYKEMPALRVAAVQHRGPYHQIAEAFGRLGQVAAMAGLQDSPRTMLAIYHDDPAATPLAELRSEAALALSDDVVVPPGLIEVRVPAGRYATTIHVGPYQFLGETWANLRAQVTATGGRPSIGASYEIYRNTPETVAEPSLLTELYLPVTDTEAGPGARG